MWLLKSEILNLMTLPFGVLRIFNAQVYNNSIPSGLLKSVGNLPNSYGLITNDEFALLLSV